MPIFYKVRKTIHYTMLRKITTIILLFLSLCSYAQMEKPYACIMINDSLEFKGGEIEDKTLLLNAKGFTPKPTGRILSYQTALMVNECYTNTLFQNGTEFGPKERKLFKNLKAGDEILFYNIVALIRPDGIKRILPEIRIKYKTKGKAKE